MIPVNQKDCILSRKNLGLPDCIITEGRLTGFIIVPKDWEIDIMTEVFDLDYVNTQIQLGSFVPVLQAVQADNNTPEATTEEFQGGVKVVVRNGLPEYTFKYVKGGWLWASALYTYNSFAAFDVLFVFSTGAIAGATNGTKFTGFDLGMLNNGTYMFTDGAASSYVNVSLQLVNEVQFNRDVALLDQSVLGFNPNQDLTPIADIKITGRAVVLDAKVYFKANFSMNEATPVGGIASANIAVSRNGLIDTFQAPTFAYSAVTGEYSFAPAAAPAMVADDIFVITTFDQTTASNVAKVGARFFKGTSDEIIAE